MRKANVEVNIFALLYFPPPTFDSPILVYALERRTKPDFPPAFNQSQSRFCSKQAAQRRRGDDSDWPSSDFQTHTSFWQRVRTRVSPGGTELDEAKGPNRCKNKPHYVLKTQHKRLLASNLSKCKRVVLKLRHRASTKCLHFQRTSPLPARVGPRWRTNTPPPSKKKAPITRQKTYFLHLVRMNSPNKYGGGSCWQSARSRTRRPKKPNEALLNLLQTHTKVQPRTLGR